ncbi:MAG: hypothetical protein UIM53_06125 [Acutalibacteraceae bacterium]|nr:hypothetical protein [Acutalibacteraceae bacterium]
MANNRIGLNDKLKAEKEARPITQLFRPREEILAEQAAEQALTKKEQEALAREAKKKEEALQKEIEKKYMSYKVATRKTFLMDPISIEALRIFTYENRKGLSEAIVDMLIKYIPRDIWREARNNIIDIEETPKDYLDKVKKLDIESIYYHQYKPEEK